MHRFLDRLYKDVLPLFTSTSLTSVSSMYIIIRASLALKYMFICCLVSSLSPMVFLQYFTSNVFSAGRSPASLLLICVPPRPKAAWLLLRSVVPYHSLFFFFCSDLAARSGCSFSLQICSLLATHLPLRQVFF